MLFGRLIEYMCIEAATGCRGTHTRNKEELPRSLSTAASLADITTSLADAIMAGRWHDGEHQLPDIEVERNVHIIADIRYFVCV
jgi:sulfite exporter TauE/SafE